MNLIIRRLGGTPKFGGTPPNETKFGKFGGVPTNLGASPPNIFKKFQIWGVPPKIGGTPQMKSYNEYYGKLLYLSVSPCKKVEAEFTLKHRLELVCSHTQQVLLIPCKYILPVEKITFY